MSADTFIDSNVLVYLFDNSEPVKQRIAQERVAVEETTGLPTVSIQVLAETYVSLVRTRGSSRRPAPPLLHADEAESAIRVLSALRVVAVDRETLFEAMRVARVHRLQWWDALHNATARTHGCVLMLTEDVPSKPLIEGLRYENPFA
jgi:predicted nucleic acid-binding protein